VSPRVWQRFEATQERVVLGTSRTRALVEKPTLVPTPSPESIASAAQIKELEERLSELTAQKEQLQQALTSLQSELQETQRAAEQRGFETGMRESDARITRQLEQHAGAWKGAAEEMVRQNDARLQSLRSELAELVLVAVAKIMGEQMANPNMARASAEQLLKESGAGTAMRVLLAPLHHEHLMRSGGAALAWFRDRRLELAADERIQYGGCILETPQGLVDGRFEVQLENLRQTLQPHYGAPR
jgi:flagellar assembly protein FliH